MTPQRASQVQSMLDQRDAIPGLEVTELPPGEGWLMYVLECKLAEWDETQPMELK